MHAPQIIVLILYAITIGIELAQHGETEVKKHNVFVAMFGSALMLGLLWWGGFFS